MHLIASHTEKDKLRALCEDSTYEPLGAARGLPAGPGWAGEQNTGQPGALYSNHLFLEKLKPLKTKESSDITCVPLPGAKIPILFLS